MPKAIKGNAGRKPPEESAGHSDIEDWFGRLLPYRRPSVEDLDESIRAEVADVHYAIKWKRAFYGLPGLGWIIEIAPYDVSVNVVFLGGAIPILHRHSAPPIGLAISRSPPWKRGSDQSCTNGSSKPVARRVGSDDAA